MQLFRYGSWQKDELDIFLTLRLSGIVLSPGHVWQELESKAQVINLIQSPFLTHHCNMNDILGSWEDFLWGDREAINY